MPELKNENYSAYLQKLTGFATAEEEPSNTLPNFGDCTASRRMPGRQDGLVQGPPGGGTLGARVWPTPPATASLYRPGIPQTVEISRGRSFKITWPRTLPLSVKI